MDKEKTRVLNNVYEYKKRKKDLETKRYKEQDIGLKEIITVVVIFTSVAIACQTESVLPALIVSIIGAVYLCAKIPRTIKFFKERHEYINK